MRRKFHRLIILIGVTLILLPIPSEAIKIVSWNIHDFPGTTGASREEYFREVIEQLDADILVVQEMLSQAGVNQFLKKVMNFSSAKTYKAAPFFDGPDSDNALFYKKSIIKLVSRQQISTALRDISEYVLKIQKGPGKGAQFRIYSFHFKAGTGSNDKKKREEEAKILRDYLNGLPPNSLFLVGGTFNMQSNKENAFKILTGTQSDNDGRSKDPIKKLGKWHDRRKFAKIHTESTRKSPYGGGEGGGLDDRYDLILISYGFDSSQKLTYKADSYIVYGNDGKHFNKSVNKGKNEAVSKDIANALYEASDHLPVLIELEPFTKEEGKWLAYWSGAQPARFTLGSVDYYCVRFTRPSGWSMMSIKKVKIVFSSSGQPIKLCLWKDYKEQGGDYWPTGSPQKGGTKTVSYGGNEWDVSSYNWTTSKKEFFLGFEQVGSTATLCGDAKCQPENRSYRYGGSWTKEYGFLANYCISVYVSNK